METMSWAEQLRRAQAGDTEAFAALFEALRPMVTAIALRMLGPADAEDAVMAVFLKVWRALPSFQAHAALQTWVYRIAWNHCRDALRSRRRRPEQPLPETEDGRTLEIPDARAQSPLALAMALDDREALDRCLAQLSDEHRVALLLRYADGMSYAEIAAATGVAIGTVMSRLFHGRRKLLQRLAELERLRPEK